MITSSSTLYIRGLYYIAQLRKNQWLKEEELKQIQEKKLRAIVNHAYHNVLFYRELFDTVGIKPEDIKSTEDLRKIPIITKREVQKNYPDKMIANGVDINQCGIGHTTGSTGVPLEICYGQKTNDYSQALLHYAYFACGLRLIDKLVFICSTRHEKTIKNMWFRKLGILRKEQISIFEPIEIIIEALKKSKPDAIYSFPSVLLLLAKEIEEKDIPGIYPRVIITHGETLTDYARKKIGDVFHAEIFNTYGAAEFIRLAFECKEHMGYHMISDCAIIEFIKDGKNADVGEPGEIVVTGLYNYEMPLIRYKLGDIGTPSNKKCACGRGYPLMESFEGRTDDFLILPSGRTISARLINIMEYIPGISKYRLIQKEKDRFVVQVVKGNGFSENTISQIKQQIQMGCSPEKAKIEVVLMDDIPKDKSGKLRAVISEMPHQGML